MAHVTIKTDQGEIKAKFITSSVLHAISPVFPLQRSIVGVLVALGESRQEYYCNLHREHAQTYAREITLEEAREEVAWCKQCKTILYIPPDDQEWLILRDRLCPSGDYSKIEIYKSVERSARTHWLISFHRLVPGAEKVEIMFPEGAFDYKDAYRDRRDEWPNAVYVHPNAFDQELARRKNRETRPQQCCGYIDEGRTGWRLCGAAMTMICPECHRPICPDHQDLFTFFGQKEPTAICSPCRAEIRKVYGK